MRVASLVGGRLRLIDISKLIKIFCFENLTNFFFSVGRKLFTKRAGIDSDYNGITDAEDITDLYKFKEGTEEERMAVLNAARGEQILLFTF